MDFILILHLILFPLIIFSSGYFFNKVASSKPNGLFGYRTRRSSASQKAWYYSNQLTGKWMYKVGIVSGIGSVLLIGLLRNSPRELIDRAIAIHGYLTMLLILGVIIIVQIMLSKNYDKNGCQLK